ncbi:MAG: hypothetical protein ACTHWO_11560 [Nesterenkonia sp.]
MFDLITNPLVTLIAGALIGGVFTHYFEKATASTERRLKIFRRRQRVRKEDSWASDGYAVDLKITTLAPLIPPIDWGDARGNLRAPIRNHPFFLAPAEGLRDGLDLEQFPQSEDRLPPNFHAFFKEHPEGLATLEKYRRDVTQLFASREQGSYFNGRKYGVLSTDPHGRTADVAELPTLRIELYDTDYFTQKVMERVRPTLPELASTGERGQSLTELNGTRNIFRNSLGLSIIVELTSTDQIILTRRAADASYSEGKRWWYVSATEAVSQSDFDRQGKEVDLFDAVHRGVKEELAVERRDIAEIRFLAAFFENTFFQDNLVVVVELKESVDIVELRRRYAKDQAIEVSELRTIDRSPKRIKQWIEENREEARPQTLYTLQCYRQLGF